MALATFHFGYPITSVTFNGKTATSSPASISYSATASISKITVTSGWSGTVYWDTTSAMSDPYRLATVSNGSVSMTTANLTYTGSNRDVYFSADGSVASYTLTAGSMPGVLSSVYFSDGTSITQSSKSCSFANTKYIRSISLSSSGSTWNGTIYWSSSSGGTTYPIADITNGSISYYSSIESIDFNSRSRTIYFTAVQATTYDTNFINLRCGDGINSFTAKYENMYGNTVRETVSGTGTTTKAVRDGTNLEVIVTSTTTGYDEPYYIVEYTSSSYSTEKTRFTVGDMYIRSNGTRYLKVFASQQKKYQIRVQSGATDATFSDGATVRWIPSQTGYTNVGTDSTVPYSLSSLPTPTRSGYRLTGWSFNETVYGTSDEVDLIATTSGYTNVITAQWKKQLTFTIYANGGVYQDNRATYRTTIVLSGDTFNFTSWSGLMTRDGYKLLGWATSSSATSPTWSTTGSFTVTDDSPLSYYAVWQQTKARITFYGNGGLWGGNLQVQYKDFNVGDTVNFATYSKNLARAGYQLLGWSTRSDATAASWDPDGYTTVGATDADYYAVWSKHIDLFYWYGSDTLDAAKIAKGQPVSNLTATIWNEFKSRINQLTIAETGSSWSYSTVSSGDGITAAEVLAARNALAALNNNVPLPTAAQLQVGKQILASYFNGTGSLKAALNIIINNYNNS